MPQRYGFHNLNRQTVFRADGTKHSYSALPENYPLELATPETVLAVYYDESEDCSTESVHVCTSTPEQLTDEEEQHDNRQAPKCFSKPTFSPERPTVGVFSLTSERSICDLEKLNGGENLSFAKKDREQLLQCSSKASVFQNVLDVYVRRTCNEDSQGDNKLLWEKIVCQMATGHSIRFFLWDPGAMKFTVLFMTVAGATKLQVTDVYKSEFTNSYEIQKLNSLVNLKEMILWPIWKLQLSTPTVMGYLWGVLLFWDGLPDIVWGSTPWDIKMVHVLHVKRSAREAPVFASSIMCYYDFGLGCTEVNAAVAFVLAAPCSKTTLVAKHSLLLSNSANSRTDHSFPKLFLQSLCTTTVVQVTKQRHPLGFLLMDEILQNVSEFRGAQLNCSGRTFIHLMITFGEWIHEVIIGAVSVGPLIDLHHSNGRLYTKTAYQDSAEQLIYMHQSTMINSSKLQRYMVATLSCWSPSLGNKSKIQWDPGIAFIHQQGVHENYNANNLLSSQHYLQILEMDIIFITFLPP